MEGTEGSGQRGPCARTRTLESSEAPAGDRSRGAHGPGAHSADPGCRSDSRRRGDDVDRQRGRREHSCRDGLEDTRDHRAGHGSAACGSCVSFATVGMVAAMAALEVGARDLDLSEADAHFCSSHGVSCGGWNNADALGQLKSRGVVTERSFPYMSAFDSPPVNDPSDPDIWKAHCHPASNRAFHVYKITDYSAWPANLLGPLAVRPAQVLPANFGPLCLRLHRVRGFDHYGGTSTPCLGQGEEDTPDGRRLLTADQCWICRNSWGTTFGGAAHADGTGAGYFKIGYGEANIDDEPMYGCHGVIAPATLPVVAGVSRSIDKMDVFAAGTNHGISPPPGSRAMRSSVGGGRSQGCRGAGDVDLRRLAQEGLPRRVRGRHRQRDLRRLAARRQELAGLVASRRRSAAPGTSVHGVSRSADKLDISPSAPITTSSRPPGSPVTPSGGAGGRFRAASRRRTRPCLPFAATRTSSTSSASAPTSVSTRPPGSKATRSGGAGGGSGR